MRISHSTMAGLHSATAGRISALIPPRDYQDLYQQNAQLRIWLPEPARWGLEQMCEINEMSMTAYLTELFACHLYGHHEVMRMRASRTGIYEPAPEVSSRYCAMTPRNATPEPPDEPNLGKNIYPLKIWIASKIKLGLSAHAAQARLTLGELCRSLICAHLFGREYGVKVYAGASAAEVSNAKAWEQATSDT